MHNSRTTCLSTHFNIFPPRILTLRHFFKKKCEFPLLQKEENLRNLEKARNIRIFLVCLSHKTFAFPLISTLSLSLSLISTLWIWNENEFPASLPYREFNYTTTKISFPSPITCIQQHKANIVWYFFIRSSFRRFFFVAFFLSLFRLQQI